MTTSPVLPSGSRLGAVERQGDRRRVAGGQHHLAPHLDRLPFARLQQPLDRLLAVDRRRHPARPLTDSTTVSCSTAAGATAGVGGRAAAGGAAVGATRRGGAVGVDGAEAAAARRCGAGCGAARARRRRRRRHGRRRRRGCRGGRASAKYSTAPAIGTLSTINHRNVPAIRRSLSTDSWSSTGPASDGRP